MHKKHYEQLQESIYAETLPNGLKVFLQPKPEMAKTYAIFSTNYGSIDQTFVPLDGKEKITVPEGIAHFLEHKLFEKEDRDVFQDFTKQGASANAFTSFTQTAYLFSATSHIEENVTTLLDFVQEPYFSDKSVEKEKGIIAQEIRMYDDQPDWRSFFGTIQSLFQSHPVRIDIAGTVESIQEITKEDLYTCYNTFYHPSNMTLFVTGNIDEEKMIELIRANQDSKTFAPPAKIERFFPEEPETVAEMKKQVRMPVSVSKCMVGIKENTDYASPEAYLKQELLTDMVLDYYFSKSGVYYEELYKKDLIDDSFGFETSLEKNFGFSIIGGNTKEPDRFADTVKGMLQRMKDHTVSEAEMERMKKKTIGQMLRAMNSLEFVSNRFIQYHLAGVDLFDIVPAIEKLTAADANDFLKSWFSENRLAVCQILPQEA
ncbi:peptidase M16 [Virgibacillus sp. 7505]|uniref:EF-P 5-aminopentanol modification-associated protein YfmH n=1 Tax=Virgibacillus sp. 7505 TaxID=2022548 RepID=UPI000BA5D988|nr:pitrilysin family protein [Virgibacillus sp. 7505]PAE16466.1 peptidase M16 [Virgibacillus sp. 7505]